MQHLERPALKKAIQEAKVVFVLVPATFEEEVYIPVTKVAAMKLADQVSRANTLLAYDCLYIGDSEKGVPEPPKP